MTTIVKGVVVGIFALVGLALTASGSYSCIKENIATRWPQTPGIIVVSEVREGRHGRYGPTRTPAIRYAYEVEGERLYSERLTFGWGEIGYVTPSADSLVAAYPIGAQVQVRYNPHDHAEAVLEPGRYFAAVATIVLGVFVLVAAFGAYKRAVAA